jgi:hypothetical protein
MNSTCELCLKTADLKLSHIVPKFVWRLLKNTVPGGVRTNRNPNQRTQDGPKSYLLCAECEQRFSEWEKLFSENLFLPLHNPEPVTQPIRYGEWAIKFAVSVSWRVLTFFERAGMNRQFTSLQHQLADDARETWRRFLLGEIENPGAFEQHLLPVDVIKDYQAPKISPFLNRYLLRSIHIDVISTRDSAHVYTKMCRLVLFGRIQEEHPRFWKGMQLHLRRGEIRPRDYHLPPGMDEYMNRKADEIKSALQSMSPRQHEIVDEMFNKHVDAIANSEIYRAIQYDVAHSGKEAFSKRKKDKD